MIKDFFMRCREFVSKMRLLYTDWNYLKMFSNYKNKEKDDVVFSLLRRACHVLDKGLHIIPFEKGHGKSFYDEALFLHRKLSGTSYANDPAFHWCEQTIAAYECAQSSELGELNSPSYHIYSENEKLGIYDFFYSRVSCRNFNDKEIEDATWNEIVRIAADAPNGCCRQTSRVYIVQEKDIITKLKTQISGATGFSNGIPYLLCVTADIRPYNAIDRMLAYVDASLFTENLVLACRANNIFTTILNFQHASKRERKSVSAYLNIPPYERVILFIAAGCVDVVPAKPARMEVNKFRKL